MNRLYHQGMGDHPLPDRPAEIEAVLKANAACFAHYPYLSKRYGQRGWQFGASDSGYIVTLCDLPQSEFDQQIDWLTGLLACRGIPSIIMAHHLDLVNASLLRFVPQREADFAPLKDAADRLRKRIEDMIAPDQSAAIIADFAQAVSPQERDALPEAPMLLISAAIDQRVGYGDCIDRLTEWLTDAGRFSAQWLAACDHAVTRINLALDGAIDADR